MESQQLSIEIFWREQIQLFLKSRSESDRNSRNFQKNQLIIKSYQDLIFAGHAFEIIDGDNFYFPIEFLDKVFSVNKMQSMPMQINSKLRLRVISVIGP